MEAMQIYFLERNLAAKFCPILVYNGICYAEVIITKTIAAMHKVNTIMNQLGPYLYDFESGAVLLPLNGH